MSWSRVLIDAVVEEVMPEILEMLDLRGRRKEPVAKVRVREHRAARIHKQQEADAVLPRPGEDQLYLSAFLCRLVDGLLYIEFSSTSPSRFSSLSFLRATLVCRTSRMISFR